MKLTNKELLVMKRDNHQFDDKSEEFKDFLWEVLDSCYRTHLLLMILDDQVPYAAWEDENLGNLATRLGNLSDDIETDFFRKKEI